MEVKNKKRKRGESEASENLKEKKPQLKKKKSRQKRKKSKNGNIKEEGLDHNESGSTGLQLVVKADESIIRKNVVPSLNIYVGGIPYYSTEDDIRSYFEDFGTITSIDCMTFPDSGMYRGIAIITYKTEAAAKRALALDGSDLGGLFLKIQPYKSAIVEKLPKFSSSVVDGYNRIYIDNLSWDTTEDDILKLFADCAVASIRLQFGEDKETGEFEGYAHVDFADGLSLHTALKLDQSILYGRPVRISCAVPKKATGTQLVPLSKDNQEDSGKKGKNTTKLEATPRDNEIDKINVIENQVTSSRTNSVSSKIRRRTYFVSSKIRKRKCYKCREYGHLRLACPKKLAANLTIPGQMIVSSEKGTGATLIPLPNDNQEDSRTKGNTTKLEAIPRDNKIDLSNASVVENQVTNSGTNALSSKIRWRTYFVSSKIRWRICYRCREYGHLSPSCPKKLAANSTIPGQMIVSSEKGTGATLIPLLKDNQEDSETKGNTSKLEATPRDNKVDQSNASVVVENQVTCSGTNALSSKIWWRTYFVSSNIRWRICYRCREYGHISSSCPKKLASDSTNSDNHDDSGKQSFTKFEATPRVNEVDRSNVSVVVENQVTSSAKNALRSKTWKRKCFECKQRGHLLSSCPKKLVADSTNPVDNQDDNGKKRSFTEFEATPRDNEVDQSNVSVVVENQVTSSGTNAPSSKRRKRTCYECREHGHLSSSCPKRLAADSTNPVTTEKHWRGCTSTVDSMPVGKTCFQIPVGSTLVRWLLPPDPWIKLNTDGSFDSSTGLASGGGLIRDHFGDLQLAFFMPLEATSSFDAELQALLHGLHLARHFKRPIWIELDALEIVLLLKTGRPGALQIQHTLSHIRALMAQIQTWITHIFREGNRPADYMATMGVGSHALNLVYPHLAPKCFLELVRMDQIGYPSFRVR